MTKIENIERWDSFYGTVIKETHSGAIIKSDIGEITGFAYTSLKLNAKCLCSVRKIKDTGFIILNIDSVVLPDVAA